MFTVGEYVRIEMAMHAVSYGVYALPTVHRTTPNIDIHEMAYQYIVSEDGRTETEAQCVL